MKELNYSLLWHSLGIHEENRIPYRNYFETGADSADYQGLMLLVASGLMTKTDAPEWTGSEFTFYVTDDGIVKALEALPKPPKLSRSKMRYRRFLEYGDGFHSFIDYCKWDSEKERSWN